MPIAFRARRTLKREGLRALLRPVCRVIRATLMDRGCSQRWEIAEDRGRGTNTLDVCHGEICDMLAIATSPNPSRKREGDVTLDPEPPDRVCLTTPPSPDRP